MSLLLSYEEQRLYDFAVGALPSWVKRDDEFLIAGAKTFGAVRAFIDYLFGQAAIRSAQGSTPTTPDWLAQHARDRNTTRQAGELDPALQARLKNIPDALTVDALLSAADAILAAAGVTGSAAILELPRDGAHIGAFATLTGTGGTFTQDGTTSAFTPAVLPWLTPPFQDAAAEPSMPPLSWQLVISGAANAGNNGTRTITGLDGDAAIVTNASGVAAVDATASWTARRRDGSGNVTDGFSRAYVGRGYRVSLTRPFKIVVILPFGTTAGTAASVLASLRDKKAGGFGVIVERRLNP